MRAESQAMMGFLMGDAQYVVPAFQRTYEWDKKMWEGLWDDIHDLYKSQGSADQFMGTIVLLPSETRRTGRKGYQIIDGQQRLMTLSLLLCALLRSKKRNVPVDDITAMLFSRGEPRLLPSAESRDREVYRKLLTASSGEPDRHGIRDAYDFFMKKVKAGSVTVPRLLSVLETRLSAVRIELDKSDDPYKVYESLNFKQQRLSDADLTRNFILMRLRDDRVLQERVYRKWKPITKALDIPLKNTKSVHTDFLWCYLKLGRGQVKRGEVYTTAKKAFRGPGLPLNRVEITVEDMARYAAYYRCFVDPSRERSPDVRERLQSLKDIGVTTCHPLLMQLYRLRDDGRIDDADLVAALDLIVSFVVRRSICGVPSNVLNHLFLQWSKALNGKTPSGPVSEWLRVETSAGLGNVRCPGNDEFRTAFIENPLYSNKVLAPFTLRQLGLAFGGTNYTRSTIEHIMPQTLSESWKEDLGPDWHEIHRKYVHTLGNLTLIGNNSELGNESFEIKLRFFRRHGGALNDFIVQQPCWGEKEIVRRAEILHAKASVLWPDPALP